MHLPFTRTCVNKKSGGVFYSHKPPFLHRGPFWFVFLFAIHLFLFQLQLNTLHLFENYLPNAQNWAYRMLINLPHAHIYVGAYRYYNDQFAPPKIHRIPAPHYVNLSLVEGRQSHLPFILKIIKKVNQKKHNYMFFQYLAQKIKDYNIHLINVHFANMGWQFLKLKAITGLPYFVSFYGFDYESLPYAFPVWKNRYKELFQKADKFICEGPFGASTLVRMGCNPNKIEIVRLGVEINKIPFKQRTKNKGELHLIQLANNTEKKGHIYALKAFIEAEKSCPNMTITFIGRDLESNKYPYLSIVKEHNLQNKVKFMNFIDFDKLYDFLVNYHVFIHPSCYASNHDCEGGAPVVILDAQATGMPVISTTHCDIPQEVIHNVTGLLTPEKDVTALAASIKRFYDMDNTEYQKFSLSARNLVEDKFSCSKNAAYLQKIYSKTLNHQ